MIKKVMAIALAAAMVLSLTACGDVQSNPEVTGSDAVVSENTPIENVPAPMKVTASAGIDEIARLSGQAFGKTEDKSYGEKDKYGRLSRLDFSFEGGTVINVYTFKDDESAKAYAGYYSEDGSHFEAPDEFMMIDYAMPIRMWLKDNEIVSYGSSDGSLYNAIYSLMGDEPFVSGGEYRNSVPVAISEDDKANELINAALSDCSGSFEAETYELDPDGEDGLGAVSEDYYTFDNGDSISIVTFETPEKAGDYFSCFKDNGDTWDNGEATVDMEYAAPAHLWLINSQVVTYCSDSGEYLEIINGAIGIENMGAGYDYFLPDYAYELAAELNSRGISFNCHRAILTPNPIYMYSPESVCVFEAGINRVHVYRFSTEAEAADHAARFSPNGRFYTGLEGQSNITIGFGREYPLRLFRKGNVVVEYSAADDSLLPSIEKVYGTAFAATDGEANYCSIPLAAQDMAYEAAPIRTDGYNSGVSYPQYAVIRSKDELDRYYSSYRTVYDFERRSAPASDSTIGFLDQADKYTDEWFENNDLVLILLEEGSGSVRHEVRSVVKEADGSYTVSVVKLCPEVRTDDMAEWHIFLEMTGCKINPLAVVNIECTSETVD